MDSLDSRDVHALVLVDGQDIDEAALAITTRGYWTRVIGSVTTGTRVVLDVMAVSSSNWNAILEDLRKVPGVERVLTLTLES
jgi:hypothetical protein